LPADDAFEPAAWPLLRSVRASPSRVGLERARLLMALSRWIREGRTGTYREFAWFARQDTKGISGSEWEWIEQGTDLSAIGIEKHSPLFLLRAPLRLLFANSRGLSRSLDLEATSDFSAITPRGLEEVVAVEGAVREWWVVENRTNFERGAQTLPPGDGIVWVPGMPPTWWRVAMKRLLELAPAPARISCDPDPSGVRIGCETARVWECAGLSWSPERMSLADLQSLEHQKDLSALDRATIAQLLDEPGLPVHFQSLLRGMSKLGKKGEQEGFLATLPSGR
jgi:hypothetical protein